MTSDNRHRLIAVHAVLDQSLAATDEILAGPFCPNMNAQAQELRELIADVQEEIEAALTRRSSPGK